MYPESGHLFSGDVGVAVCPGDRLVMGIPQPDHYKLFTIGCKNISMLRYEDNKKDMEQSHKIPSESSRYTSCLGIHIDEQQLDPGLEG